MDRRSRRIVAQIKRLPKDKREYFLRRRITEIEAELAELEKTKYDNPIVGVH